MVAPKHAISAYQATLRTLPPLEMIVMLYDGAMHRMTRAAQAARNRDYETQFNETLCAAKILNGLSMCLDMRRGGKVAQSLRDMYKATCSAMMSSIARGPDSDCCDRIIAGLRMTRNAWAEIAGLDASVERRAIEDQSR